MADTGASPDSNERRDIYDLLRDAWVQSGLLPVKRNLWVGIQDFREFGEVSLSDGLAQHSFGTVMEDFSRLAAALASDIPAGVAVLHLDKRKTFVFLPGQPPSEPTSVESALSWLRRFGGLGLAARSRGNDVEFGLIDALWSLSQSCQGAQQRRELLMATVSARE